MDNFSVTIISCHLFSMSLSSLIAPTSHRPPDGYVPPQGILSPPHVPTKLHQRVELSELPFGVISSETYLSIAISQRFTDQDLSVYQNLLSCSQSLPTWIAIYDEIALKLTGRLLFPELPHAISEESAEMSHDYFSAYYAPEFSQDPSMTFSMLHFFHYLYDRFARKSMD